MNTLELNRVSDSAHMPAGSPLVGTHRRSAFSPALSTRNHECPFEQILVATDFSAQGEKAVQLAAALALQIHGTLTLLHVIDANPPAASSHAGSADALIGPLWQNAMAQMVRLKDELAEKRIPTDTLIVEGLPWEQIAAQSAGFDFLVLGKAPAPRSWAFFSRHTARRALEHAACPVLTA